MRNLKLKIEYDGTNYCGWQTQTRLKLKPSIQQTIEKTLQKILQEKVCLIASGRTDAGVHAQAQVANFKTKSNIPADRLQRALNALLPNDIVIERIEEADLDFHSRFSAKSKVYRYTILNQNQHCVFFRNIVYFFSYPLDIKLMRKESRSLLGRHDFKSFCGSGSNTNDTLRTIKCIAIKKLPYHLNKPCLVTIDIEADGFLYGMARSIVGTLLEIGRGRFFEGSLKKILLSKNRNLAGPRVPACGLCLMKVKY